MQDHLSELNNAQKEAVLHQEGPLLIVAGAGAGKTRTLTYRILNLIKNGVRPEQILAITFTNKAAGEMRERVKDLLENLEIKNPPFVSTFHSLGVYILRNHGGKIGLSKYFSIYDKNEAKSKIREAMKLAGVDDKRFEPGKVLGYISKQKGSGTDFFKFAETANREFFSKVVVGIWMKYEELMRKEKALDFDDLLLKTVELLRKDAELVAYLRDKWKYIHIDEYQDTNTIQYEISKLLVGGNKNICVVGDADQSIYSWRGADFSNILNFEKDYEGAKVVLLEENYRSTKNILAAANEVIKKNKKRKEKNLFTKNKDGEQISLFAALDEMGEAQFVAGKCQELIREGVDPSEIAVLYRANFQSRVLEEAFLRAGLPYEVLGTRFYERKEVKDIVAFITLALNPDDTPSMTRVINVPPRGIGKVTLDKIFAGKEEELPAGTRDKVRNFRKMLATFRSAMEDKRPSEVIKLIIERAGIEEALKQGDEEAQERLENLKEFVSLAAKYDTMSGEEGLLALVTEVSLVSDQDTLERGVQGVRLSTVHAVKGLEFNYVFVTGLEQDLFPHRGIGGEERDGEEERRLFYVAITRAREKVFLTYTQSRMIFGIRQINMPSEFIFDISDEFLQAEDGLSSINY